MANRRFLTQGFHMDIVVSEIGSIKPMSGGEIEGNKYSAGVKIKASIVEEIDDPELGFVECERRRVERREQVSKIVIRECSNAAAWRA